MCIISCLLRDEKQGFLATITNAITRGDGVMTDKTGSSQSVYIRKDVAMILKI